MNKNFKAGKQGGFTLIELIVVIVILGILAATALPKFADLGGDARLASLKAAKGAVSSASSLAHAKALVANSSAATLDMEGVTVNMTHRYPSADASLAAAAGLSSADYDFTTIANGVITVKVNGAADTAKCAFTYTQATAADKAPVIADVAAIDCK